MSENYQGWSNYETWSFAAYHANKSDRYDYLNELALACWRSAQLDVTPGQTVREVARHTMALTLRHYAQQNAPIPLEAPISGLYTQLLVAAIERINFREVADAYLRPLEQEVTR